MLAGQSCLVTGATRGIGRAIARMLVLEGAQVAICGRRQDSVDQTVAELIRETGGKVEGKAADVRVREQLAELFRFIDARFGGLDVLVNNAGVGIFRPVSELSIEEWKSTIETNLYGVFYATNESLVRFETRGRGYIVNISSLAGANAFAGGAAYNASKFALTGFSEAAMQDLRSKNVRVSYIMPGSVATEFGGSHLGQSGAGADWKIWPEDVAEIVKMLLLMPARTLVSRVEVRPSKPPQSGPKR
jgi:NAD(P)-dependent dehydrogenase (short-subunit alcohol dehydrogenase family)